MSCMCGYSRAYPSCDGTHNTVKIVRDRAIQNVNDLDLSDESLTPEQIKEMVIKAIRKR